jgi:hypothetical protein
VSGARFSILGSCVTSELFRFGLEPPASYHARTSVLSIMSPPLALADDDLDWASGFAKRAVQADFAKTFFDDLEKAAPDYLIVDFVDDRFALLRAGESWFVRSNDFIACGGDALERYRFVSVPRTWSGLRPLWREACRRFAHSLRERFPDLPVVVHRAAGITGSGALASCDGIRIRVLNRMLDEYASWFGRDVQPVLELSLPGPYRADGEHYLGHSPFHYEERYYREAADILRSSLS